MELLAGRQPQSADVMSGRFPESLEGGLRPTPPKARSNADTVQARVSDRHIARAAPLIKPARPIPRRLMTPVRS